MSRILVLEHTSSELKRFHAEAVGTLAADPAYVAFLLEVGEEAENRRPMEIDGPTYLWESSRTVGQVLENGESTVENLNRVGRFGSRARLIVCLFHNVNRLITL